MAPVKKKTNSGKGGKTAFGRWQDQLKWVDLVFEVRDSRLPETSTHPNILSIVGNKPRLIILSKSDLVDLRKLDAWLSRNKNNHDAGYLALNLKDGKGKNKLIDKALELTEKKRQQIAAKGLLPRPMRAIVVGLPNVGKSSFINWLVGGKRAKVGNQPGVTRGMQWIRLHKDLELLDSPGILPNFALKDSVQNKLALLNLIQEGNYDFDQMAESSLSLVLNNYPDILKFYKVEQVQSEQQEEPTLDPFSAIAQSRRFLSTGGELDRDRAKRLFVSDLRSGLLGRIMLDTN